MDDSRLGDYTIERILGRGGFGVVYVGVHAHLGRRAAIKQLLPAFSRQREYVERFFNEARAAASIDHPGIVEIYDVGWHTDGSAYFAMKLLDGESLARRLRARGPLSLPVAATIARQVAAAVGAAHARQIVHRDLKPDNILLVRDAEVPGGERAVVVDFGIAKLVDDRTASTAMTSETALLGTPLYMSPEQCRGASGVDHRTDIYALGCILFEMLAGRPPHVGRASGEVVGMHQFVEAPALSSLRPDAAALDAIVARCLAKDLADRFQSLADVATALDPYTRGIADVTPPPREAAPPAVDSVGTTVSAVAATAPKPPPSPAPALKRRWRIAAAVAVVVGGGAIVVAAASSSSSGSPRASASASGSTIAPPGLDAAPDPDIATLESCRDFERKRDWNALAECAGRLHDDRLQKIAVRERNAQTAYEDLLRDLKAGTLRNAPHIVSNRIPADSLYAVEAAAAVRRDLPKLVDASVTELRPVANDCAAYRQRIDALWHEQNELFALLVVARLPCTDKTFAAPAIRPDDACDFDLDREEGKELMLHGAHAQAATLFAHALECVDGDAGRVRYAIAACLAKRDASTERAKLPRFAQLAIEPLCR